MDLASIIVNFGLFVASVIAAIIAWRGVRDAQIARDDAAKHEAQALQHAREAATAATASAAAQQRAAEALEEANRREASRDAERLPWTVTQAGSGRWRVTNNSGGIANDVEFMPLAEEQIQLEDGEQFRNVPAGQPVFIHFGGGMTDPPTATVHVEWNDSLDHAQQTVIVLG